MLSPVWFPLEEWLPLPFQQSPGETSIPQIARNKPFFPWSGSKDYAQRGGFGSRLHLNSHFFPKLCFSTTTSLHPCPSPGEWRSLGMKQGGKLCTPLPGGVLV